MKIDIKVLTGIKNASYLAVGNLIVQIITFIGFVYIARLLGPDNYGIYVTVGTFVGIFDILLLGGLNKTVLREGSKDLFSMYQYLERTIGVRRLSILVAIIACIVSSFFTPYQVQTKLYIIIFSAELAYTGMKGFLGTIYQATEKMQYISFFNIANKIVFVSLSIILLHYGFGLLMLFLIALFSNLSSVLISYKFSQKFVKFDFFSNIQFDKTLLKPAVIFSLITFIEFFTTKVDLLMISFLGTSKDVGIYGVAYKFAQEGMMLRNVIATAFFPIFVKQLQKKRMRGSKLVKYSLVFLLAILILSLIASLFVKQIIALLCGIEYRFSGNILEVLIFYLAFAWSTLPFTTAAQATHNEKYMLMVSSIMAVLNIVLNYLFFLKYGLIGIAYSTLTVFSLGGLVLCGLTYRVMRRQGYLT